MYAGVAFIFAMSIYGAVISVFQSSHQVLYSLTQPILWTFTFSFMIDGLRRIRLRMNMNTDCVLVYETYIMLVTMALLSILL